MQFLNLKGKIAKWCVLFMMVMEIDVVAEGIGQGVAFAGTWELRTEMSIVLALHNIPEGMVVALLLIPNGVSLRSTKFWVTLSTLP